MALPGNREGMTLDDASPDVRTYWVLVDVATGRGVPPHLKFTDPVEAVEYHLNVLGGRPRYQLQKVLATPEVDPHEPRVW